MYVSILEFNFFPQCGARECAGVKSRCLPANETASVRVLGWPHGPRIRRNVVAFDRSRTLDSIRRIRPLGITITSGDTDAKRAKVQIGVEIEVVVRALPPRDRTAYIPRRFIFTTRRDSPPGQPNISLRPRQTRSCIWRALQNGPLITQSVGHGTRILGGFASTQPAIPKPSKCRARGGRAANPRADVGNTWYLQQGFLERQLIVHRYRYHHELGN